MSTKRLIMTNNNHFAVRLSHAISEYTLRVLGIHAYNMCGRVYTFSKSLEKRNASIVKVVCIGYRQ